MFSFLTPGSVQDRGHDGTRLRNDRRDRAVLVWLCDRAAPVGENRGYISPLFGAAVHAASLRLRDEGRQVCAHCCWKPQGIATLNFFNMTAFFGSNSPKTIQVQIRIRIKILYFSQGKWCFITAAIF